jgi:hypothetical protein
MCGLLEDCGWTAALATDDLRRAFVAEADAILGAVDDWTASPVEPACTGPPGLRD